MKKASALLTAVLVFVVLIVFGVWFFHHSEGWSFVDAFYFSVMILTTVGYGDFVPTHDVSKIVTSIYGIICIPIVLFVFGVITESYFESRIKRLERRLRSIITREEEIEKDVEEIEEDIEETEDKVEDLDKK